METHEPKNVPRNGLHGLIQGNLYIWTLLNHVFFYQKLAAYWQFLRPILGSGGRYQSTSAPNYSFQLYSEKEPILKSIPNTKSILSIIAKQQTIYSIYIYIQGGAPSYKLVNNYW